MADQDKSQTYINEEGTNLLTKACSFVSCQLLSIAHLYYLSERSQMTTSGGSQSFVRGRGGFQSYRAADESQDREFFCLTPDAYEMIVSYLEIPENFQAITGGGRKTVVGKKYGSKMVVFKSMLVAIQHHGFPKQITAANLQKRFQRYVKRYKDARFFKLDTGGGLTDEEIAAGTLLKDRLEKMCPHFERMHALYGARPNMAPPIIGDVGVDEEEIIQQEDMEADGDLDEDSCPEYVNPTSAEDWHSTELNADGMPCSRIPRSNAETPGTLRNHTVGTTFWKDMEDMATKAHNSMPVHLTSCDCSECRNFGGVQTGDSPVRPTESCHNTELLSMTRSPSTNQSFASPVISVQKATKSAAQAAKEVSAHSKPSFTQIYLDHINQKSDYRRDLIQSRDKWKAQELEERRQAQLETQADNFRSAHLQRKHQLALEAVVAENALKRARAEFEHDVQISISKIMAAQDHEREMAKAARKTALLTTLFGSSKTPAKIKDLLPIIDSTE